MNSNQILNQTLRTEDKFEDKFENKFTELSNKFDKLMNMFATSRNAEKDLVVYKDGLNLIKPKLSYGSGRSIQQDVEDNFLIQQVPLTSEQKHIISSFIPNEKDWFCIHNSVRLLLFLLQRLETSNGADGFINWVSDIKNLIQDGNFNINTTPKNELENCLASQLLSKISASTTSAGRK